MQELDADFIVQKNATLIRLRSPLFFNGFTVPAGFVSDGASIPRIGWIAIGHPFHYDYIREAIGHDYLYRTQRWTRQMADRWFRDKLNKPHLKVRRWVIWGCLRAFGWIAWWQNGRNFK